MKEFESNRTINGSYGEVWLDDDYLGEIESGKAEVDITYTDIQMARRIINGKKMTKAENRSKQQQSDIMIFLLILVVVYCLINSLPILKDCIEKNYTMAHGEYIIETAPATKSGLSPTEWVVITTDDGARIVLDYPRGKDLSELPDDTCYGTVWYSENSHYILEFIPDEPTDGN